MALKTKHTQLCFELGDSQLYCDADFTCAVCLDVFSKPKTLPCGHSYCAECLQQLIKQKPQTAHLPCPKCKASHHKVILHQLMVNKHLLSAIHLSMGISETMEPSLPTSLQLTHSLHTEGLLLTDHVHSVTLSADGRRVIFTTENSVYCYELYSSMRSNLAWKKDYQNITSLAATRQHILMTQPRDKLTLTSSGYSCWIIHVLDIHSGDEVRQLHAGLGQECSLAAFPGGKLALTDTGSYKHHAQPCVILINEQGSDRKVVTTPNKANRLIKPTSVIGTPHGNQIIVYDAGDSHLKCFFIVRSTLILKWKAKVKNFRSMTADTTRLQHRMADFPEETVGQMCFVVLTKNKIALVDYSGNSLKTIDGGWTGTARSVSTVNDLIAVSAGRDVLVYSGRTDTENKSCCFYNMSYVV